MSEDIKLEVIKKTQDLLGKYFKKPPLTEKLLKKPPFRFLHDIISAVIRETGFLDGLFTEEEMNSDNVKDKETKLAYLTKLIDVVKLITGVNLTVRASKIISGQEPTKTNELLQAIGKALDKKISSKEAIEHYKKNANRKLQVTVKSKEDSVKRSSKKNLHIRKLSDKEKLSSNDDKLSSSSKKEEDEGIKQESNDAILHENDDIDGKLPNDKIGDKQAPEREVKIDRQSSSLPQKRHNTVKNAEQDEKPPTTAEFSKRKSALSDSTHSTSQKSKDQRPRSVKDSASVGRKKQLQKSESIAENDVDNLIVNLSESEQSKKSQDLVVDNNEKVTNEEKIQKLAVTENTIVSSSIDSSANNDITTNENVMSRTSLRPPSVRPISARPAAPRMRVKTDFIINEDTFTTAGNVNVILENFDAKEDDAEDMVVMEAARDSARAMDKTDSPLAQEHGHLVAQILETQKELINTDSVDVIPKKVEIEWEAGTRRDREAVIKEVDKIRSTIQMLTRATNPLGKLLDFVQEDVEIMQNELREWQRQYEDVSAELEMEKVRTEQSVEPMKESLQEITNNINQQLTKIRQVKFSIIKNDQKIQRLLNGNL